MREIGPLVAACALALLVVAGVVFGAHDTTVLVSPPEAVAEEFTRTLTGGRYDMALDDLDHGGPAALVALRTSGENLRAVAGAIDQVAGESSAIMGDEATATVTITTAEAGELRWSFVLVRRAGQWKIREWRAKGPFGESGSTA